MRCAAILATVLCMSISASADAADKAGAAMPAGSVVAPVLTAATDVSAQARRAKPRRRAETRARTRFEVRPLRRPAGRSVIVGPYESPSLQGYRRECVPVFEERQIPQWGGSVLYASQNCRWVRG